MALRRSLAKITSQRFVRLYSVDSESCPNIWTKDNTVRSPFKDIQNRDIVLTDYIWENLDKWADKTAVICGVTNRSYTYWELHKLSRNFASKLRLKFQISDGDVVCIMMHNLPEFALAALGAIDAGATVTTVNPIYTAHEVHRQLVLSKPKVIIGTPETIVVIKEALKMAKINVSVLTVKGGQQLPENTICFEDLIQEETDQSVLRKVQRNSKDIAFLPYSSGTTGLPKGVELTHNNVVVNCIQQNVEGMRHFNDTTGSHQDSVIAVLPFYHIYGLSIVLLHKLSIGAKVVTLPKFQPSTFLTALKEHRISLLYAAPPMVLFLGSHPDAKTEHLASIDKVMCGAAPLPKKDVERILEKGKKGMDLLQVYGLTETSPLVSSMIAGSTNFTSAGFALSNTELRIVGDNGKALPPNQVGELHIRGPQVMKGYRDNPEATRNTFAENGWFKSGDLATLDEDGAVTIVDRLKELIKVKGYQVPPAELESVLKDHPSVLDAAVVGVPDARLGEMPRAFIVLKENKVEEADTIKDFVKQRVADYKKLKDVTFLESLPKNASGKILRRVLKEKYC